MNNKSLIFLFYTLLLCTGLLAQESNGGVPLSFLRSMEIPAKTPVIEMPEIDVAGLMLEDSLNTGKDIPYRFGYNHYVFITPENSGEWVTLKHSEKVWRLGIKCPKALSINITFAKFNIPDGATLFVYSKNRNYVLGAFTSKNMQPDGQFGVDIVPGEEIVVEYNQPANATFDGQLNIFRITHAYRDVLKIAEAFGQSGSCHNNVVCPIAQPWAIETKSVALMLVNGSSFCTGALINNANQDGTPYFLSANHCYQGSGAPSTWVFRFNYNSPTCSPLANGTMNQTLSGSTLIAQASASDFMLLKLNSTPPPSYNVCYAGWSRSNIPPSSGAAIHHPSGDVKKISFTTTPFDSATWVGNGNKNHWNVQWSNGVTEGGSSGGPIFDQNHRIVGQLHGGPSFCGAPQANLNDDFGKFFYSWDINGNTPAQRLKDWLDPNNTGLTTIDSYCPNIPEYNAGALNLILPSNALCDTTFIPQLIINNIGVQPITSLTVNYSFDGGAIQTITLNNLNTYYSLTDTILLPQINYLPGNHTYTATITDVNGQPDTFINNNSINSSFNFTGGVSYTLSITTNGYADESGFTVVNENNDTIFSIAQGTLQNNTNVTYTFCLPEGCYTFIANDAFGDGMCCQNGNGSFTLSNANSLVIAAGGAFGFTQLFPFCTTLNSFDVGIDTILSPIGNQCFSTVTPKIIIRNLGSAPLTNASIGFQLNTNAIQTYNWSGNLAINQTDTVILDFLIAPSGFNSLKVFVYNPNGQLDENNINDTLVTLFSFIQGNNITVNLITDNFPTETSWKIINALNNIVEQSPQVTNPYLPNSANSIELCLANGCYKFIIADNNQNGICCAKGNGGYTILSPNNTVMASGGQFLSTDTVGFCLPFVGIEENVASAIKLFPNPATGTLYLVFGNTIKENVTVELINAQGQLVQTNTIQNANIATFSVANLPTGFYMVRAYGNNIKPYTTSIIIKN